MKKPLRDRSRSTFNLRNRQRTRAINLPRLRQILRELLNELIPVQRFEIGFCLVDAEEITRINETFLRHAGPTDVITFDYSSQTEPDSLHGEIFICVSEAVAQARRFRTTWQAELVRYAVHGVLHLLGHDDQKSPARRKMKREEDRLVEKLTSRLPGAGQKKQRRK